MLLFDLDPPRAFGLADAGHEFRGFGRVPDLRRVEDLVDKYMDILDVVGMTPRVVVRDNLGSKWLGRTIWTPREPDTTVIQLQKAVLAHEDTLERVLAHEMIHHKEMLELTEAEKAGLRVGIRPPEHGEKFRKLARKVNDVMGEDFVTEKSDQTYVQQSTKTFYVLVMPMHGGPNYGFAWAVRLTPNARSYFEKLSASGARLLQTTNPRWARGAKLGERRGLSVPVSKEDQDALRQMYERVGKNREAFERDREARWQEQFKLRRGGES